MAVLGATDAEQLAARHYDVAIVGAGINGAAIAREAALRGLSVVVLERADIGSGTSSWSSRLIHGGLRYLEHGELRLVHESLHDRERLLHIAPHLVKPLGFVVPIYRHNHKPGWMFRIGMVLYDALSSGKSLPRHRTIGKKAASVELASLDPDGLTGGLHYYDGQVEYAERLVLETVLSAVESGAVVQTYAAVEEITCDSGRATGVRYTDLTTGAEHTLTADVVVNAAGPWLDELAGAASLERMVGGTKGAHLVVDPFPGAPAECIYYEARSDNRAILVIPWNDRYLIGTTDERFTGDPGAAAADEDDVDYLIRETNALIPGAGLRRESVLFTYAGVRPLPYRPDGSTGAIPRSHLIVTHPQVERLVSIVGGKLTPHLSLGTETVDVVAKLLGVSTPPSHADSTRLPGATDQWASTATELADELRAQGVPDIVVRRLIKVYGGRCRHLIDLIRRDPAAGRVIGEGRDAVLTAEIDVAIHDEGATHLTDLLHRRTMVGLEPALGCSLARDVAEVAAPLMGWDCAQVEREVRMNREYVERRLRGGLEPARDTVPV
ncbi:glycerol-3-phosphate dehydrogenase [Branchiibius hedensis]|uniref:Glycerol-3-phosphate dehydrogenase n=1 Tax=Branchiibius hedensis TaxID=672460 RepID=A0A2Y9BTM5_9MICO|nr:glycerol-3-phosphate dehydrogenase/oxidase [Branchiibius hedensis]PWJ25439.1 glycerol-3-phosphate dehydrogenase [Branchiibius hedensis]SSA34252.1 glycerol-3-phosphate dehydrogenase [Branchiibius hedensis]